MVCNNKLPRGTSMLPVFAHIQVNWQQCHSWDIEDYSVWLGNFIPCHIKCHCRHIHHHSVSLDKKNGSVWWVLKYTPFYCLGDSYHCWLHVFMRKFRFVSCWRGKTNAGSWNGTVHAYWDCPSSDWWHEVKSSQDSDDVLEKMNLPGSLSKSFRWQGLWTKFFTMLCPLG